MSRSLRISTGQHSDRGCKPTNQDFHGICIPKEPQLSAKGIAVAIADGISSSDVSQVAAEAAVRGFLEDYFCTSDAWSVKHSARRVLLATNSWLHAHTRRSPYHEDKNRGYVCTLSAMVLKSTTAHLFHIGDTRVYRLRDGTLEQLTNDHRFWVSRDTSYLSRALGSDSHLEIDYRPLPVNRGDVFLLATDGVYEHADSAFITRTIQEHAGELDQAARAIVDHALENGSKDNLTLQIVRVDELPTPGVTEFYRQLNELPFPPVLEARAVIDGYTIVREIHITSRSRVYLAIDNETDTPVVIKTPATERQDDEEYLERFLMEEWIARRINSEHVLKPFRSERKRNYLYIVMEFVRGQTLRQWMIDNPKPRLTAVRNIVEQIGKGLNAFHRLEMLHQDLRPDNIMIDRTGTVKIIDFGSARVAGIAEVASAVERPNLLGTAQYTAPEYFLGEHGTPRSDLFSLAVITYQMLTGKLPYGTQIAKTRTAREQRRLKYRPIAPTDGEIPLWVDEALRKALHPDPDKRYEVVSEFVFDLHQPNRAFLNRARPPLLERNPAAFWQGVSLFLALLIVAMLGTGQPTETDCGVQGASSPTVEGNVP